jgi:hypothetical protein
MEFEMFKLLVGFFFGVGSSIAFAQVVVSVPTNGVLVGYVVQNNGKDVCRNPMVWNKFRGETSYIVCDWQDQ